MSVGRDASEVINSFPATTPCEGEFVKDQTIVEGLTEAQRLIQRGWTRHQYFTPDRTGVCAMGALAVAWECLDYVGVPGEAERLVAESLAEVLGESLYCDSGFGVTITYMNDYLSSKQDVVVAFGKAICKAQEKGL
jgi:hypothetical protein